MPSAVSLRPNPYLDESGWKTWHDSDYSSESKITSTYELQYPPDFDVYRRDEANGGFLQNPRVKITFPQDAFKDPKTNFGEAYVTVSLGKDAKSSARCLKNPLTGGDLTETEDMHGTLFYKGALHDAAAGNIYDSELYRARYKNYCYEMILTLHTGNIHNYPGDIAEFNPELVLPLLSTIAHTFRLQEKRSSP